MYCPYSLPWVIIASQLLFRDGRVFLILFGEVLPHEAAKQWPAPVATLWVQVGLRTLDITNERVLHSKHNTISALHYYLAFNAFRYSTKAVSWYRYLLHQTCALATETLRRFIASISSFKFLYGIFDISIGTDVLRSADTYITTIMAISEHKVVY